MAGTELDPAENDPVVANHVDTAEVPSAAWGWSGEAPRASQIAGFVVALMLLAMTIGNHTGRIEDLFLVGFAVAIFGILIRHAIISRQDR
ncbi:DUF2631 domain-containing protein [Antrihabitans spumae]|uniref:DUF2631 domain-containing protein n=1 Tax=Antrihabitans spumae TaxID=3373370 RepID=A0ABW7KLH5_9NOCA